MQMAVTSILKKVNTGADTVGGGGPKQPSPSPFQLKVTVETIYKQRLLLRAYDPQTPQNCEDPPPIYKSRVVDLSISKFLGLPYNNSYSKMDCNRAAQTPGRGRTPFVV